MGGQDGGEERKTEDKIGRKEIGEMVRGKRTRNIERGNKGE